MLSTIVIGGGPGGLGLLLWTAQQGVLGDWLDRGLCMVEARAGLGGTLGRFGIASDSLGGTYLEFLDAPLLPVPLRRLRDDAIVRQVERHRGGYPPLPLVDRLLRHVGGAVADVLRAHDPASLRLGMRATALRLRPDGSLLVEVRGRRQEPEMLSALSAVVALGGRPRDWMAAPLRPGLCLEQCRPARILPSDRVLTRAGLREVTRLLPRLDGRRIVILGGAHSAYSVAGALLTLPGAEKLAPAQVVILQRRPPPIFYPDADAAAADDYAVKPGATCPRTGRVNRLGGLRGDGRETWRRLTGRPGAAREPRLAARYLVEFETEALRRQVDEAALVIPCFGYRAATLPIYDPAGRRLALRADAGGDAVGPDCRVLLADGSALPNVFGIGLGTGFRPSAAMGGEPAFDGQANSLWLYQNDIAALVHREIAATRPGPRPRPAGPRDERAILPAA